MNEQQPRNLPGYQFSSVFEKSRVTSSYKFFWFDAILDLLKESASSPKPRFLSEYDLYNRMILKARPVSQYYKLFFGSQDSLPEIIENLFPLKENGSNEVIAGFDIDSNTLLNSILDKKNAAALKKAHAKLGRYVKTAFLSPWATAGELNNYTNQNWQSHDSLPLYRIVEKNIEIHPRWYGYLMEHMGIMKAFCRWHMTEYFQTKNPFVPGIAGKLDLVQERKSLNSERQVWQRFSEEGNSLTCIYSNESLKNMTEIDIDHFIPWSFVLHNQVWNTAPVSSSINRSKSDRLPPKNSIHRFATIQFKLLKWLLAREAQYKKYLEQYSVLFHGKALVFEKQEFENALGKALNTQIEVARGMGFSDWDGVGHLTTHPTSTSPPPTKK